MMGGENKYGVVTDDFHDLKTFTDGSSICVGQTSILWRMGDTIN